MTVWLVNPFDNLPLEGLRPQRYWLMARAFVAAGCDVVYWTADFSHAFKRRRQGVDGEILACGVSYKVEGIDVRLIHEPPYAKNICLSRLYAHWRWSRNWRQAVAQVPPPDVLIVSSPPLSLGAQARAYCRQHGVKLVVDIQDAWPETFARVVPRPLLAPLARVARRTYCAADAITAVAQRYVELARQAGAVCPMHVCYHGIATYARANRENRVVEASGRIRLIYIGNMSLSYDLATVVAAVKADARLELDLAGAGPDEAALRAQAVGCERIRFHGYLAEGDLRALLARAEAGVVPMFDAACVGIPGKFADYAAAGLPIINSLGGEAAELLAQYQAGVRYAVRDTASFGVAAHAVRSIKKEAVAAFAVEFDAQKLYNRYYDFICGLCKRVPTDG